MLDNLPEFTCRRMDRGSYLDCVKLEFRWSGKHKDSGNIEASTANCAMNV